MQTGPPNGHIKKHVRRCRGGLDQKDAMRAADRAPLRSPCPSTRGATAMTNATHGNQTSQVTVYAAIELSKKSWVISIARPDRDQPSIHRITGGNFSELVGRLRTAAKNFGRILV